MLVKRVFLILLMGVGSIAMWLAVPLAWLYLASRMVKSSQPTLGPYVLVLVGIPISMIVIGKLLSALNRQYSRAAGHDVKVKVQLPWHRSMRGERDVARPRSVLDVVMVISVSVALLLFAVWFFVFAGSSLPGS